MVRLSISRYWFSNYLSIPLCTKAWKIFPSPLICIVIVTLLAFFLGLDVRTVGDMGALPNTLPIFLIPDIPLNLDTLLIILPYSLALAAVGLLESMMTATIVDEMTDSPSNNLRNVKVKVLPICLGFYGGDGWMCHDWAIND
ncbi:SulP family inorganic anion transporter [Acinetobacter baumannii]|nr:SulP family inorganic anion transporter [Acinetobacter baumannii]